MTKLWDSIKAGASESGMGVFASQNKDEKAAQRNKKDPLFGISGKRGMGPYSKESERLQSHSLLNSIVSREKKSGEKDKEEAATNQAAQEAADTEYARSHPMPLTDTASEKIKQRKKIASQRRSSGRLSTVLSDTLG